MIARLSASFDRLPAATGAALMMVFVGLQVSLMHAIIRFTTADLHPLKSLSFAVFLASWFCCR